MQWTKCFNQKTDKLNRQTHTHTHNNNNNNKKKKTRPVCMLSIRYSFQIKRYTLTENEGLERGCSYKWKS